MMTKTGIFAIVAAAVALTAVRVSAQVTTTFTLVGTSQKVCQLNGDTDWESNTPTAAQTLTNFGMQAADLGTPVDTGGSTLYFLFGDTWPADHPPKSVPEVPPDDSVGTSTLTTAPTSTTCLGLQLETSAPKTLARPTVTPAIDQGFFNVPSGGVYSGTSLYAFFWTNHCANPNPLSASPSNPLKRPGSTKACPESDSFNSIGNSVLGQSAGTSDVAFNQPTVGSAAVTMPNGFVYVNAVDSTNAPNLAPSTQQLGVYITGVPRYRASVPYLAYATAANLADPSKWMFLSGVSGAGTPKWISRSKWDGKKKTWAPPSGAEIYSPSTSEQCIGEHSLTWNAPLSAWLLLYNCKGPGIEARYAPAPWGPWSDPIVLLSPAHDPGIYCTLIMSAKGCPGLTNYWPTPKQGGLYAPFILNRFTQDVSPAGEPLVHRATIYWLVSTWNPYVVVVMQSTLEMRTYFHKPVCSGSKCI